MSEVQARGERLATVRRVTAREARTLAESGDSVLVDTRDRQLYGEMHAAGAIDVPLAEIESSASVPALASIPAEKSIIFYCT